MPGLNLRVCKLSAIAAEFAMHNEQARAAIFADMLSRNRQAECVLWANAEAEQIGDEKNRDWARMLRTHRSAATHSCSSHLPTMPTPAPGQTGVYYDEDDRSMQGSTLVRDPKFQDRVVAETRALLATVPA
jgi:hypothetical protein